MKTEASAKKAFLGNGTPSHSQESKLGAFPNRFTFGHKPVAVSTQANPRECYSVKPKGGPTGVATQPSPKKSRNEFASKTQQSVRKRDKDCRSTIH